MSWDCERDGQPNGALVFALFALALTAAVAAQHHEFTHPDRYGWAILAAFAPFALSPVAALRRSTGWTRRVLLVAHAALVLGSVTWMLAAVRNPTDFAPFYFVLLVSMMAEDPGPIFGALLAVMSGGILAGLSFAQHDQGNLIWCFAFVISWIGGTAFGWQVQTTHNLELAQAELSRQAVEQERHRLARDVHDLVAHSLAVTMLHLTGARLSLQHGDEREAISGLEQAESAGRQAMAEIHRTVGLLGSSPLASAPTPSAPDLPSLIGDFEAAGLVVELELDGDLEVVPLANGLATYRIVQESLSNAVKHAPGAPVRVRVAVSAGAIAVRIENPVVGGATNRASGGHGVRGMSERAELLGGTLGAGNGNGSWVVDATIPWRTVDA